MTGVNMFNGFPESYSAKTLIGNAGWESRSIQIFHPDLHPNSTGYKVRSKRTQSPMHDIDELLPIGKGRHVLPSL